LKHSPDSKEKTVCPHSPYPPKLSTIAGGKIKRSSTYLRVPSRREVWDGSKLDSAKKNCQYKEIVVLSREAT